MWKQFTEFHIIIQLKKHNISILLSVDLENDIL